MENPPLLVINIFNKARNQTKVKKKVKHIEPILKDLRNDIFKIITYNLSL